MTVLGFPCNQFGGQEPGTDAEIHAFATTNYDANFQIFSKVEVNGDGACGLYQHLKAQQARPDGERDIAWNFTKFLVDGQGKVLARYEPGVTPEDVAADLKSRLG